MVDPQTHTREDQQGTVPANGAGTVLSVSEESPGFDLAVLGTLAVGIRRRAWYAVKLASLGWQKMFQEHPSTEEEPFKVRLQGAIFGEEMERARLEGRVCSVPVIPGVPVDTWWDFGWNDTTVVVFSQTVGREIHVVDWHMDSHRDLGWWCGYVAERQVARKWRYGQHYAPHDVMKHELGSGKTLLQTARESGVNFVKIERVPDKRISIDQARRILPVCWFDREHCCGVPDEPGLVEHLEAYTWEVRRDGTLGHGPKHDVHSNPADAVQQLAMGHPFGRVDAMGRVRQHKRGRTAGGFAGAV